MKMINRSAVQEIPRVFIESESSFTYSYEPAKDYKFESYESIPTSQTPYF
jgi:hypothetical protein